MSRDMPQEICLDLRELRIWSTRDRIEWLVFLPGMNPNWDLWKISYLFRKLDSLLKTTFSKIVENVGKIEIRR